MIVDDILYYNEPPFQDGPIAQAVNAVTADGALYFSSAGNEGNTLDGTSGHYEGDFVGSGRAVGKIFGEAHDFDPGPEVQLFDPSRRRQHRLGGDDVLGRAARQGAPDYDLYVFDSAGNLLNFAQNVQDGDDDATSASTWTRSAAAIGSPSCATRASRATSRSRPSAAASRPPPTACAPGPRRA